MLRLRIVSDQRRSLAERVSTAFSVEGGTIGRSADNDWVLPDPQRYISAHHARVQFREGHFYLQDVSTNGVYVNDEAEPLAKRGSAGHRLANGDVIRMGEYHILASLEEARNADAVDPAVPTSIHSLRFVGPARDADIGSQLNLEDLLVPAGSTGSTGSAVLAVDAYGQAVNTYGQTIDPEQAPIQAPVQEPVQALVHAPAAAPTPRAAGAPARLESTGSLSIGERMARLAEAVAREPRATVTAAAGDDVQGGLAAFCRGAGIAPEQLPAEAAGRLLHLAGRLFREALVGLKDMDRSRADTRNRYRVELPPPDADDPRPVLSRTMVEELMVALFLHHEGRRLDSVQWLRETVSEAKIHEGAVAQATRAAFVEFLDRLDPAELEARFERAARRGKARAADKAQYWDLFINFYRNLIEMPADHLPHTFVEAFASAYREALKKPA
ncbi:MAG: type VI secretion system-associated FHA domain protein TagH [Proteobacteria bacterium]|nr:type VI secretion system-associated FHA domain protein TagH [Pseudomonadota bacterium]